MVTILYGLARGGHAGKHFRRANEVRLKTFLFGQHLFDHANNRQQNAATNAARSNLADDRANIHATATSRCACANHAKDLSTQTAANNTGKRIAERPEAQVFHNPASSIATDRTRDQINNTKPPNH